MKEGKEITNIKKPSRKCLHCGWVGRWNEFQFGMLWWSNEKCPECGSGDIKNAPKQSPPPAAIHKK